CPAPSDFDSAGWNDTTRSDRCNPNDRTNQTFRVAIPMQSRDLLPSPGGRRKQLLLSVFESAANERMYPRQTNARKQ
ncbi:MAG: hypothetical protein ABGZ35_10440, partial [Planctomycetaceae bacterium]